MSACVLTNVVCGPSCGRISIISGEATALTIISLLWCDLWHIENNMWAFQLLATSGNILLFYASASLLRKCFKGLEVFLIEELVKPHFTRFLLGKFVKHLIKLCFEAFAIVIQFLSAVDIIGITRCKNLLTSIVIPAFSTFAPIPLLCCIKPSA